MTGFNAFKDSAKNIWEKLQDSSVVKFGKWVFNKLSSEERQEQEAFKDKFYEDLKSLSDEQKTFFLDVINYAWEDGWDFSISSTVQENWPQDYEKMMLIFWWLVKSRMLNMDKIDKILLKRSSHLSLEAELQNLSLEDKKEVWEMFCDMKEKQKKYILRKGKLFHLEQAMLELLAWSEKNRKNLFKSMFVIRFEILPLEKQENVKIYFINFLMDPDTHISFLKEKMEKIEDNQLINVLMDWWDNLFKDLENSHSYIYEMAKLIKAILPKESK